MSGWVGSDRRDRLPDNWAELVRLVKERDGGRCRWILPSKKRCPRPGTDVDHKNRGDDHRLENLQLLCGAHHAKKTAGEAHAEKRAKKASRYRPHEQHPGRVS